LIKGIFVAFVKFDEVLELLSMFGKKDEVFGKFDYIESYSQNL
jgi:hypothetical protein